jgi:hypothetical protein
LWASAFDVISTFNNVRVRESRVVDAKEESSAE